MNTQPPTRTDRRDAWTIAVFALLALVILHAHIAGVLIIATFAYLLMTGAIALLRPLVPQRLAKPVALACVIALLVAIAYVAAVAVQSHMSPHGGFAALLDMLANTLERLRTTLPSWIASNLPASIDDLQHSVAASIRSHATNLQHWGHEVARGAAHLLIGSVIGILAGLEKPLPSASPWLAAVRRRGRNYALAFSDIVRAQLLIAAVNTALTALFLLVALPLADIHVPFSGALVVFTFVAGLLPIVGNLLSNAAILLAALTVSNGAALATLAFLLVIHKLEYFLNARFVGRRAEVPAAALLATMLLLEAVFGLEGLVLAPILCAWAFREARDAGVL